MLRIVIVLVSLYGCFALKAPCFQAQDDHVPMPGAEEPRCHTDGSFLGMQYRGSAAICVTKSGERIGSYEVHRMNAGPDMNCNCARDQEEYRQTGMLGKMFHCARNGNYGPYGCTGSVCYCQDENGDKIGTNTVPIGDLVSIDCE